MANAETAAQHREDMASASACCESARSAFDRAKTARTSSRSAEALREALGLLKAAEAVARATLPAIVAE